MRRTHDLKNHEAKCNSTILWFINQVYELHCRLESVLTVTNRQRPEQLTETAFYDVYKASPKPITPKVVFTKGAWGISFPCLLAVIDNCCSCFDK